MAPPGIELLGPALQLDDVHQPGLVEVHQPPAFAFGGAAAPLEPGQLGSQQLIVGDRGQGAQCLLTGQKDIGAEQRFAHLVEDEGVQGISADVPFPAAVGFSTSTQRVMVASTTALLSG